MVAQVHRRDTGQARGLDTEGNKLLIRNEDPTFLPPDPAKLKKKNPTPDPTLNRNEEKNTFIF